MDDKRYKKHPYFRTFDKNQEKFYPVYVGKHGFIKIFNPSFQSYLATAGYLTKRCKYYRVSLQFKHKKVSKYVHRLIADVWCNREVQGLKIVHHIDHNTKNNICENLQWTTTSLNALMKKTSALNIKRNDGWYQSAFTFRGCKVLSIHLFKTAKEAKSYGLRLREKLYVNERKNFINDALEQNSKSISITH